jgi:hypothetical protein
MSVLPAILAAEVNYVEIIGDVGILGVLIYLIATDKWGSNSERDRLRAENEVLRNEIKVLNESIRGDIVPPLVQINSLMKDVIKELGNRGHYFPPEQREG